MVAVVLAVCAVAAEGVVPADRPPDFVPLGAYLSWERIAANAAHFGIDRWDDVLKRLDALETNHVNLLWVTNMSESDLPRLLAECGRRGMKVLPSMGAIEARVDWRWTEGSNYYDTAIPSVLEAAGDSEALAGWVLSDEPQEQHLPRLETLRLKFRDLDPGRFCTAVTMWPQTPLLPGATDLPVVCVDLYPFFGPNDPNGPHTDAASRSFFRRNATAMLAAIGNRDVAPWIMGMAFCEIWGPREYDENGHLVGLPGAYCHWRCPTPAEMRWQVWETLRVGAKGFICYTLAPEAPRDETATLPPADVTWKDVLVKTPTDMGPNALTNPDGSVTPQLEELGRVYAALAPHTDLILRWKKADSAVVEAQAPGHAQTFADPDSHRLFAVVLNDNLQDDADLTIRVSEQVAGVTDLIHDRSPELTPDFAGGSSTFKLVLAAGEGTLLAIDTSEILDKP